MKVKESALTNQEIIKEERSVKSMIRKAQKTALKKSIWQKVIWILRAYKADHFFFGYDHIEYEADGFDIKLSRDDSKWTRYAASGEAIIERSKWEMINIKYNGEEIYSAHNRIEWFDCSRPLGKRVDCYKPGRWEEALDQLSSEAKKIVINREADYKNRRRQKAREQLKEKLRRFLPI